jgi:hypothetical protein
MRHIRPETLDRLEAMLEDLRKLEGLKEKKRGVFYRGSRAFLHFHEDPAGLFADLRLDGADFERYEVTSRLAQRRVIQKIRKGL